MRLMHAFRALRSRNYRLYFFGQAVSMMGTWMTTIATSWLVYRLTHSAVLLGIVGFASQIPAFVLAPVAGVLADRWNRQRVLMATQVLAMLQSLALAGLALGGLITVGQIILLSAAQGLINAFDIPSRQAFVVDLVEDPHDVGNAIALNSSIFNGARLVGPSIAGLIIAAAGEGVCFLVDGISYLAVLAALAAMRLRPGSPPRGHQPLFRQLREGLVYAYRSAPIRAILLLTALVSLVGMPYAVLMPVFAQEILGGGPHTFGFLMAASGLGALAGALSLAVRKSVLGLGRIIPMTAGLFGAGLIALSLSRVLWLSLAAMLAVGFGMLVQIASGNTILQTVVDEDKRGRVMSLFAASFMGMAPFGSLLAGGLASRIGAPRTLFLGGLACLAGAALFARELPRLRRAMRPIYVKKGILPEVAAGLQTAVTLTVTPEG